MFGGGESYEGVAEKDLPLARAADALEQQARKEKGAEAERCTTAAKGLRGL
jgi:hypothetical protein